MELPHALFVPGLVVLEVSFLDALLCEELVYNFLDPAFLSLPWLIATITRKGTYDLKGLLWHD